MTHLMFPKTAVFWVRNYALNFQEKRLTLEKFVQWQRVALIHSVLPPDSLKRPAEIRSAVASV